MPDCCGIGVDAYALEAEGETSRPHEGELVDSGEGEAVEIEDVVAVVDIGHTGVDFKDGAFADREFAFDAEVETVVVGKASGIVVAVNDTVDAVGAGEVGVDAICERDIFVDALGLSEGEAAAIAPSTADFPFMKFTEADGGEQVDGVATVVVGVIGENTVVAVYPAQ